MLKFTFCALLVSMSVSVSEIGATFTNIQTSTYDDIPAECVTRIEPHPFTKVGNKYYLIVEKNLNWFNANDACKGYGAELATINSADEMNLLSNYLASKNLLGRWLWISGNDLGKEGTFKWSSNGQFMTYTKWSNNQPDNDKGNENCVHLWEQQNSAHMNDRDCSSEMNYICEMKKPKTITFTLW